MRSLKKLRRLALFVVILLLAGCAAWIYWNRPVRSDLAVWAPADSLAFVEVNDLAGAAGGVADLQAWKSLSVSFDAPARLTPNRFWIWLARWTGIGSTDTVLLARSQVAVIFSGAQGEQKDSTLTIKPLTTFVVETHTSQSRMRSAVESHIEKLARRVYTNPSQLRKQQGTVELIEWIAADPSRQIVFSFVGTAVVVGNDEASVLRALEARSGSRPSLAREKALLDARTKVDAANAAVFGFASQAGAKSLLQAIALNRGTSSGDDITAAKIFADTMGGVVSGLGWSARFRDGMVEDHCSIFLADGAAEKLRSSMVPDRGVDLNNLPFVPANIYSISFYQLRDLSSFWVDLHAVISSHTDLVGAIAVRPMLRGLLKPYGVDDPDTFVRAVGPRLQTVRFEENTPPVLITEAFDRPALRKAIAERFGKTPRTEKEGEVDLLLSPDGSWAATFVDNYFLIGPNEAVRRALAAKAQPQTLSSNDRFRKSQQLVDVSVRLSALSFTTDSRPAISFVEAFANNPRSPFASNAQSINDAINSLPFAVSVSHLKGNNIEWTSRSSFGLGGSLIVQLFPGDSK
jgi:hypothetical protein